MDPEWKIIVTVGNISDGKVKYQVTATIKASHINEIILLRDRGDGSPHQPGINA